MNWYVLQVMTGREREVCEALRRKGVKARAPDQRMEIRRRGQWQTVSASDKMKENAEEKM